MKPFQLLTLSAAVSLAFSAYANAGPDVSQTKPITDAKSSAQPTQSASGKAQVLPGMSTELKTPVATSDTKAEPAKPAQTAGFEKKSSAEQFFPIMNYKMGPYAAGGNTSFQGYIDYMAMLNARDGGVNNVKLTWEECENEYKPDMGVACYEKLKSKNPTSVTWISTATVYATIERSAKDKIPLVFIGNGRTDATDGRYFPYAFPLLVNYLSQSTAKIKYIAQKEGGIGKLEGKTIVNLYHGSQYGRETIKILDQQAEKYGFKMVHIEVPHPGVDQTQQWKKIRQIKPDWVLFRSWGAMTPAGLRAANRIGYPIDRVLGNWWGGAEEDVMLLGDDAKGYVTTAMNASGTNFPVLSDIMKHVYKDKKPDINVGSSFYNRGVQIGVLNVEAMRIAQEKYGKGQPITGEQMRWGLEHLKLDDNRMKELGVSGMFSTLSVSCSDHEGGGKVTMQRWNGKSWDPIGEVEPDRSLTRSIIEESSVKYGKEKGLQPRDCSAAQ